LFVSSVYSNQSEIYICCVDRSFEDTSYLKNRSTAKDRLPSDAREVVASLRKYYRIVPEAWRRYLTKLEATEYELPSNEAEMRYFLFSECLDVMRKKRFRTPFQLSAEDEILRGKKADFSLGRVHGRFVAVELKLFPEYEKARKDILKLREYVKEKATCGFFLMLADATGDYQRNLDLKALGIEENGAHSWFGWETIKPKHRNILLETLIVSLIAD